MTNRRTPRPPTSRECEDIRAPIRRRNVKQSVGRSFVGFSLASASSGQIGDEGKGKGREGKGRSGEGTAGWVSGGEQYRKTEAVEGETGVRKGGREWNRERARGSRQEGERARQRGAGSVLERSQIRGAEAKRERLCSSKRGSADRRGGRRRRRSSSSSEAKWRQTSESWWSERPSGREGSLRIGKSRGETVLLTWTIK